MLSRDRGLRRHDSAIPARLRLADRPPGQHGNPDNSNNRPARTARPSPLPATSHSCRHPPETGPVRFSTSFRASPRASSPVAPPARRSGRKEHHCARYTWAHERSSRSPSRGPSSSASPRRPRPPQRSRRRPSRSSRSPRRQLGDPWRYGAAGPVCVRLLRSRASTPTSGPVTRRRSATGDPASARVDLPRTSRPAARRAGPTRRIGDLVDLGLRLAHRHLHRQRQGDQHAAQAASGSTACSPSRRGSRPTCTRGCRPSRS